MERFFASGIAAGFFVAALTASTPTFAQSEITVYAPFRGIATPIARAGSSVSVITREEIEQAGQISVAELLRTVPGVSFTTSGGFGSATNVRIRGADSQHTMVLIDGVPVTDTTSTRNDFDFTMLPVGSIERIEVLRGPQSALYGSDALGGVISITTLQQQNGLSGTAAVEGGSFGTHREALTAGYGSAAYSLQVNLEHTQTDGFSRRTGNTEDDGTRQWSGGIRAQASLSDHLVLDSALQVTRVDTDYDRRNTDPLGVSERLSVVGHARARLEGFDGRWRQTVTAFGSMTDRNFDESSNVTQRLESYEGSRFGLDYTSEFDWDGYGTTLFGATVEQQSARYADVDANTVLFDDEEVYWGAFVMHQASLTPSFHVSAALRFDDFAQAGTFVTGRATAVYEMYDTETRFHASIGTAAKAPSLRQRISTPTLNPEESWGFDGGVTQTLFDGRLTVDVTGYYQRITNLHVFDTANWAFTFATEGWLNIGEAELYGIEATADARLIPGQLDALAHYTYLVAEDATTGLRLPRRPEHEAGLTLTYTGIDRLRVSGTLNWVGGERFNSTGEANPLDPYVRVDANASYQVHEHLELFGRIENLFDAQYEEIAGYNTPGLSAYAGIRATF